MCLTEACFATQTDLIGHRGLACALLKGDKKEIRLARRLQRAVVCDCGLIGFPPHDPDTTAWPGWRPGCWIWYPEKILNVGAYVEIGLVALHKAD